MVQTGRKTRRAQPCRDSLRDMDRTVAPARTAERDRDIGFSFGPVAGEEGEDQVFDPGQGLLIGHVAGNIIGDRLIELSPVFTKTKHMLGDDFTMLDVALAPLLWRLDHYGIKLGKTAAPLMKYAERIFSRPAFIEALTPSEKVMRK